MEGSKDLKVPKKRSVRESLGLNSCVHTHRHLEYTNSKMAAPYTRPKFSLGGQRHWKMIQFWTVWTLVVLVKHGSCQTDGGLKQEFTIAEERPVGTVIGQIGKGRQYSDAPPPYQTWDSGPGTGIDTDLNISETGVITVKGRMDRETRDRYSLVAISVQTSRSILVKISVVDINDHAPEFSKKEIRLKLLESSPRDAKYSLGSAVDKDLGINTTQRYEIASGNINNAFRLGSKRAPNGILFLDLAINGHLDFETTPSYNLVIKAYDGGSPPKFSTMRLNITIIDANDNQPIFNQSRYFAKVPENATVGTSVLQVFATDRDSGENGEVRYQIDRQRSDPMENFDINPITGIVYINKKLDYEKKQAYELIVVARDNGTQKLQTTAIVSIQILDINDNEPTINLIFLTEDGTGRISEKAKKGEYVARVSVSDPDVKGYYSSVNVSLHGGDGHFGLTTRDNVVYLVMLSKPLDREFQPLYTLTIRATDSGTPPLRATKTFTVKVKDTNDNAPTFTETIFYADIQEVVPPGSSVIQLTATDKDEGNNSLITYEILHTPETHSDWFQIDNRTGLVTTKARVDCETASEPRLIVRAIDSGVPPMSSNVTVVIRIRDVNDNQPVFDQSFYNVSVLENTTVGSCILKVSATDPDCGVNAKVMYSIASNLGFQHPSEFEIRLNSGQICVTSSLDYEKRKTYEFPVLAKDQDGLDTTAMVKIVVVDVNDNHPIFYPVQYNVNLNKGSPSGTEVAVVQATDKDSGMFGRVRYRIIGGNQQQNLFQINSRSGVISLKGQMTSTQRVINLAVSAHDGGGKTSQVNANVSISVADSNRRPPMFGKALYHFNIKEDATLRSPVGQVRATSREPAGGTIAYSIVSGDPGGHFTIDTSSGQLKTNKVLDHDTKPSVLLNIQARAGTLHNYMYGTAQVNISIQDVNDNAPKFAVNEIEIPVKEDIELTHTIYIVQAIDKDSGRNAEIRYSINDPTKTFAVDALSGKIRLQRKLDYEKQKQHRIIALARDQGSPSKQSSMNVIIDVQDVNDNPPVFTQAVYSFDVNESIKINEKFAQVNSTDADSGNNARITYVLQDGNSLDTFGIFANTGYLYNRVELDRERTAQYKFNVVAIDNGIPPKTSTASVIVNLLDSNDNPPIFLESSYNFSVKENQQADIQVGSVRAVDLDQADRLKYYIQKTNAYFNVDPIKGTITTKQALDRELFAKHEFRVWVTDQGIPAKSVSVPVVVYVEDLNDNRPKFQHVGRYEEYIYENKPPGTTVAQVSAIDTDVGDNKDIVYSFVPNGESKKFHIHPVTGLITTSEMLDHETKSLYVFKVRATDKGTPPLHSEKNVEVHVKDENENPPKFNVSNIAFSLPENTSPGVVVGHVQAHDKDSGENGRITYYIISGNSFGVFGLNATTGDIFVSRPVDYEESSGYVLRIRAMDNSVVNPMSSTINVNISIIDLNDNAPQFEEDPVVISVNESLAMDTSVYTFSALDKDSGDQGRVNYDIVSQTSRHPNEQKWFSIDPTTGNLKVTSEIDFEKTQQISLVVRATDQTANVQDRKSTTVSAMVLVEDINDNSPQFKTRDRVDIMEDEPVGYPVLHVIATDADSHDNGKVSYTIVKGNEAGHFRLDSNSGLLTIATSLDRETKAVFKLNISAIDNGKPRRASYQMLQAYINDVNDNPPVFQKSVYQASVAENMNVNSFVTQLLAKDKDSGKNAELKYIIPYGIADNKFKVGLRSGQLNTNATLDRESQDNWVITAYVKDGAFPALYDTTTILVKVLDVNDNVPVFKNAKYELQVPENSNLSVIHTVRAMDTDSGKNGTIAYRISAGDREGKFSINSATGELSCRPLDREVRSSYNLTVEAQDGGSPPLVNKSYIYIKVLDVNDNTPIFKQNRYTKTIPEDKGVGQSILTVVAQDFDEGINAKISYSLNNASEGQFKINNETGVISTAGEFDREKKDRYLFEVHAIDGGLYGPRKGTVTVVITIGDVNDNAPVFEKIPYQKDISQGMQVGTYVVGVTAIDKDEGDNSKVTYSFETVTQYFKIDPSSGHISTKQVPAVGIHTLDVLARDWGSPSRTSKGVVEIRVGNAPGVGSLRFSNLTYNVYIPENARRDSKVVRVSANLKSGRGQVSYSFASGNEDNTFHINPSTGDISVMDPRKLDYESSRRLRLIVVASANNAYGYTTVWVNLKDMNDNPPRFTQDRYSSSVWEGEANTRGTYVTQVIARDIDKGDNGRVRYSIVGGNMQNAFLIYPPNTGIVRTNIILDREIRSSYKLEIEAVDSGKPRLTSTCTLRIQVIDINDNSPHFPAQSQLNIREGTELGTMVLHVTANDVDLNPVLTYYFAPNGNPNEAFSIDRFSGKISVAKELDYERKSRYQLKVQTSDKIHIATMELVVNILDENDNSPEFSQQSYQVTLPELTGPHYSVITVNASDKDSGDNSRLSYTMLTVAGFYIDAKTGTIYTNKTVTFNPTQPTIHLVVTAKDHGKPSLSAVVAVRVQVIDINNHAPVFTEPLYRETVSEDDLQGKSVLRVLATDADDSYENKKIDFSIIQGNEEGVFQISSSIKVEASHSSVGEIVLTGQLDRERTAAYSLTILAKDRGEKPLSSTAIVKITIADVNDNKPKFNQTEPYQTELAENVSVGTEIVRVYATDKDAGDNGRVQYIIASGNDGDCFMINVTTGMISVKSALDYEKREIHRLTILAMDGVVGDVRMSALATVIINVTDVNEFEPHFPVMMYLENVDENKKVGTFVFTAHANDKDKGVYGKVTYQLNKDQELFVIDKITGRVTTGARFDYESMNSYQFEVMASDRGGKFASVGVLVNINPVDEFSPKFEKERFNFEVPGNARKGTVIGTVLATDNDHGRSGVVIYSFQEEHEYFAINRTSGVVYVQKDLQDLQSRRRRWVSRYAPTAQRTRFPRALEDNEVSLIVLARSGSPNTREVKAIILVDVDRTCAGCQVKAGTGPQDAFTLSGTPLVLVVVFAIVAVILMVVILVMYWRGRGRKRQPHENSQFDSSFDTVDRIHAPPLGARELPPPTYNEIHGYQGRHLQDPNITTSEMSDQSHSASSGRGSAEDGEDEDEEIRMINATPIQSQALLRGGMPDSGIQPDDDAMSERSVQNHKEYLARLGIDSSKLKVNPKPGPLSTSVESMHQFSDEGGGEGDGLDISNLVYSKLGEVEADENLAIMDGTREFGLVETDASHAGSLSSVINSEEEFSGSYNWDYLLDWGPQYQPLAHVFAEIARLKDDNIQPKKLPITQIVPQRSNRTISLNPPQVKTIPPPIITDAPPRTAQPVSTRSSHTSSTSSTAANSARTSQLTSMPSLPRSPISHDSSFTSPAMSPSFTPSLSPLATRSPSISPLVTPKGSSGQSSSGQTTPQRHRSSHTRGLIIPASSESEQELHI